MESFRIGGRGWQNLKGTFQTNERTPRPKKFEIYRHFLSLNVPFIGLIESESSNEIYGLLPYTSMYGRESQSFNGEYFKYAMRVYKFKKYGHNKELFKNLIYGAVKFFNCNQIVAIPSSKAGEVSKLEELLGKTIKRTANSTSRKYSHSKPVNYTGSVELLADVKGRDVLLVDDIVTTGKSINWYKQWLLEAGASSVIPVGLGMNINAATDCPPAAEAEPIVEEGAKKEVVKKPLWVLKYEEKQNENEDEGENVDEEKSAYEKHKQRAAERQAAIARAGRDIGAIPECKDGELKERMKTDLALFLKTCLPDSFSLPFSKNHKRMIPYFQSAFMNGEQVVFAAPRAEGKTTFSEGVSLWALLNGWTKFLIYVGASKEAAMESFESIRTELESNERLVDYYPEVAFPIQKLEGQANRAKGQLSDGKKTNIVWKADKIVLPTIPGSVAAGSIFIACGYDGRLRGRHYKTADGQYLRPTAIIFDDVQKDKTGKNPANAEHLEQILKGVVKFLGKRGEKLTILVPGTRLNSTCFMSRMLDKKRNPSYQGLLMKAVENFPKNMNLWKEYWEIWKNEAERLEQLEEKPDNVWTAAKEKAQEYYKAHFDEMNEGADISWPENKAPGDLTGLQSLMNLYLEDESAFMTELQNEPQDQSAAEKVLTAEILLKKIVNVKRGIVPITAQRLTCAMDLQLNLIYWLVCAWGDGFSGHVVDWGTYPAQPYATFTTENAPLTLSDTFPGLSYEGQLYQGLSKICPTLYGKSWTREDGVELKIERGLIDANWARTTETVMTFLHRETSLPIYPSRGKKPGAGSFYPAKQKMASKTAYSYLTRLQPGELKQTVWVDTNKAKSAALGGLYKPLGERGVITLPATRRADYELLIDHFTSQYIEKWQTGELQFDIWKIKPGRTEDHWWDCLCLNIVANAMLGGVTDEQEAQASRKPVFSFEDMKRRK